MRTVRTADAIGKSVLDFLTPLWKVGTRFIRADIQRHTGKKHNNAEMKIIKYLVKRNLLDKQSVPSGRKGTGGAIIDAFIVMQDDQDKLINTIADCSIRSGRGQRRRAKKMREKLQEKKATGKGELFPMDKTDIKLLTNRIKELLAENENLKYELGEEHEKAEALQEKIEELSGKATQTNGLLKSCPNCNFNLQKYVTKYGSQLATILQDCKL